MFNFNLSVKIYRSIESDTLKFYSTNKNPGLFRMMKKQFDRLFRRWKQKYHFVILIKLMAENRLIPYSHKSHRLNAILRGSQIIKKAK